MRMAVRTPVGIVSGVIDFPLAAVMARARPHRSLGRSNQPDRINRHVANRALADAIDPLKEKSRENRPKAGSKSDAVLTTIEAPCKSWHRHRDLRSGGTPSKDDANGLRGSASLSSILKTQGFLEAKGSIASTSRSGPRMVASYELMQDGWHSRYLSVAGEATYWQLLTFDEIDGFTRVASPISSGRKRQCTSDDAPATREP